MKKLLVVCSTFVLAVSCGGGGNGDGAAGFNHNELVQEFVGRLNLSSDHSVTVVKSSTKQFNFLVVKDAVTGEFNALTIDNWNIGIDAVEWFENNANRFYYDLVKIPGYYDTYWADESYTDAWGDTYTQSVLKSVWVAPKYYDDGSGLFFEKVETQSKDLEKAAAFAERLSISNNAKKLQDQFGLSKSRATELSRLTLKWQKAGGKTLTDADQDAFAKEALGVSITDAKAALQKSYEGNTKELSEVIKTMASTNSISPEHMEEILFELF